MPPSLRRLGLGLLVALLPLVAKAQVSVNIHLTNEREDTYDSQIHLLSQTQKVAGYFDLIIDSPYTDVTTDPVTGQSIYHYDKSFDTAELRSSLDGSLRYQFSWDPLNTTYTTSGSQGFTWQSGALSEAAQGLVGDYYLAITQDGSTSRLDFSLGLINTDDVSPLILDDPLAVINGTTSVMSWSPGVNDPLWSFAILYKQPTVLSETWTTYSGGLPPRSMTIPQQAYQPGAFTFFGAKECARIDSPNLDDFIRLQSSEIQDQHFSVQKISSHLVYVGEAPVLTAVPEPSTYGLIAVSGLLGLGAWRKRRRQA